MNDLKDLVIRKVGNEWCLFTKDGKRKLGCHKTKKGAEEQERAIMVQKHTCRYLNLQVSSAEIRTALFEDREHLVVPVVALTEGVIHAVNAETPELVLAEEIGKAPQGWNGRPVVGDHPSDGNQKISANEPKVLEDNAFGIVFNTKFDNKKLKLEAWLDPEKAKKTGNFETLDRLKSGEMIEVSVGVFVINEKSEGIHNGKPYKFIWRNIIPDHLAMLPKGMEGACNNNMGCGAPRTNQGKEVIDITALLEDLARQSLVLQTLILPKDKWDSKEEAKAWVKEHGFKTGIEETAESWRFRQEEPNKFKPGSFRTHCINPNGAELNNCKVKAVSGKLKNQPKTAGGAMSELSDQAKFLVIIKDGAADEVSDIDLRHLLDNAIRAIEPGYLGIEAVFDSSVIYATMPEEEFKLFQRNYSVKESVVSLEKSKIEVKPVTRFEPVTARTAQTKSQEVKKKMIDEKKASRVKALIESPKTIWDETDAQFLGELSECKLTALEQQIEVKEPEKQPEIIEKLPENMTEEDWLKVAPENLRKIINEARANEKKKHEDLVKSLSEKQKVYDEKTLSAMSIADLENIEKLIAKPTQTDSTPTGAQKFDGKPLPRDEDKTVPAPPSIGEKIRASRKIS